MPYGLIATDWEARIDYQRMRKERLEKAQAAIKKFGLDALVLFRFENVRYVTGHRKIMVCGGIAADPVLSILTKQGDPYIFTMDIDSTLLREPWIPKDRVKPTYWVELESGARGFARAIKEILGPDAKGKIGIDNWVTPVYHVFPKDLPGATFVDGQDVMMDARMVKTRDEMECLKSAVAITEAGFEAGVEALRPGVRECEVLGKIWDKVYSLGAEWTQSPGIVCADTGVYRRFTSDRIIQEGDTVVIDIGAQFNGYFADYTRTWYLGKYTKPSKEQKEVFRSSYQTLRDVEKAIRPGVTTGDVFKAAGKNVLGKMIGHGIGLAGQEIPFIAETPEESIRLKPGMTFAIEPFYGRPGVAGVRLEDDVVVTETGCEVLSTFPFGPLAED
jgi:Xaa-Pro aminopeptidase